MPDMVMTKTDTNPMGLLSRGRWLAQRLPSYGITFREGKEGTHGEPQEYTFGGTIFKIICQKEFFRSAGASV